MSRNPGRHSERELIGAIENAESLAELQEAVRDVPPDVVLEFHEEHCDDAPCRCNVERITVGEFAPRSQA